MSQWTAAKSGVARGNGIKRAQIFLKIPARGSATLSHCQGDKGDKGDKSGKRREMVKIVDNVSLPG